MLNRLSTPIRATRANTKLAHSALRKRGAAAEQKFATAVSCFRKLLPSWHGAWKTGGIFQVEIEGHVRRAVRVEGRSQ